MGAIQTIPGIDPYTNGDIPRAEYNMIFGTGYAYYGSSEMGRCTEKVPAWRDKDSPPIGGRSGDPVSDSSTAEDVLSRRCNKPTRNWFVSIKERGRYKCNGCHSLTRRGDLKSADITPY